MKNREIKFRVKSENLNSGKKYWVYVDLFKTDENPIASGYSYGNPIDRKTVGQLLWQKDRQGSDIYEGDVLKHYLDDNFLNWLVNFQYGCIGISNIGIDGDIIDFHPIEGLHFFGLRVKIGNIHDNPDLLKP